jgi:hypothetical protein
MVSSTLSVIRIRISWATGRPVHIDSPRSPRTSPQTQSTYWRQSAWSSPRRARSARSTSSATLPPSPASLSSTTSPGSTRSSRKTSVATPSSVGTISRSRFRT